MKKYIRLAAAAIQLAACVSTMYAIPAKKGVIAYTQADGTTVEVELTGDEFAHMYLTPEGYPLTEHDGFLYYADIKADGRVEASEFRASIPASRSSDLSSFLNNVDRSLIGKALETRAAVSPLRKSVQAPAGMQRAPQGPGLIPGSTFPTTGSPRVLVILAEYSDVSMTLDNAHDYFTRMMTERGFSDYGGTGSAIDYFEENSNGQFTPVIDVYGPVTLPQKRAYYGGNSAITGEDRNAAQMIADACEALDDEIDFSKYDNDGDGMVDNVYVFYAGRGEADGGSSDTVWPHSWYVYSGGGINCVLDGVRIDRYACSNEYDTGRPDGVGTFIHEFSHVMGLPDLYSTNYSSAFTPGPWSALDYGPYNNNGCTPPLYSAYERYALGWIEPVVIDGPLSAVLRPIGDNVCGIIKTGKDNEFFLVENRQQTSWDKYIPGHGMLMWHIDYNSSVWQRNAVNNSTSHQYVDLEEADGIRSEYTRAGDSFPGTSKVTSFTDDTNPSMRTWAGAGLSLPITNISEDALGLISFDVSGGSPRTPVNRPTALAASDVSITGFTANWEYEEGTQYLLSVYTKDASGQEVYTTYNRTNAGSVSSFRAEGLEPDTKYYYTVSAISGFEISESSNEIEVTTLRPSIDNFSTIALPASNLSSNGFTANWEALPEATSYLLSVYELTSGNPIEFTTGFDGNVLPEDWTSSGLFSQSLPYSGEAAPSISLANDNYIETAEYGDIYSLSFWHRATSTATGTIVVSTKVNGEWSVYEEREITTAEPGVKTALDLPVGTSAVRISYSGTGSLRIDDVSLTYGRETVRNTVSPYDKYDVGNVTSYEISGLESNKIYSYIVQGTDGSLRSKESAEIRVNMSGNSGIGLSGTEEEFYVNGADGELRVRGVSEGTTVTVYDPAGRIVASSHGESTFGLSRGVYIVRAGAVSKKVIMK